MSKIYGSKVVAGKHKGITGLQHFDKVVNVDQAPIGRTPRSNPATYTGVCHAIRKLFSQTPEARVRGYQPGRFSFNVKGGRCEACAGDGTIKIEMHFLPDVYVPCEVCKGARYNRDTLDVTFKGKNIAEVLDLSCEEAAWSWSRARPRWWPRRRRATPASSWRPPSRSRWPARVLWAELPPIRGTSAPRTAEGSCAGSPACCSTAGPLSPSSVSGSGTP